MAQRQFGSLTFSERIERAFLVGRLALTGAVSLVTGPIRGKHSARTIWHHVLYRIDQVLLAHPNNFVLQSLLDTFEDSYLKFCSAKGIVPSTSVTADGVKGHWLGRKNAKVTYLFFTGGGYKIPPSPGHIEYLWRLQNRLNHEGHDISILFLSYALVPYGVFPAQLREATMMLNHLIEVEGREASNVFIGGDSAGAHLAVTLISQMLHPRPDVPPVKASTGLRGAILISPMVSFAATSDSFKRNGACDALPPGALDMPRAGQGFTGGAQSDSYSEPIKAPAEWWKGIDRVVRDVFIWGGANEIFVDDIKEFAGKIGEATQNSTLVVTPGAGHEEMIFDVSLKFGEGEAAAPVEHWIKSKM